MATQQQPDPATRQGAGSGTATGGAGAEPEPDPDVLDAEFEVLPATDPAAAADGEPAASRPEGAVPEADAAQDQSSALAELEDRWRRALADLDNLRKRYARELERERAVERARVAAAFLPVIDNLELALAHSDADPAALIEGVRAVRDQAVSALASLGYRRDAEVGIPFDPGRHEAVSVVDAPEVPPGMVVRVLRPGYGGGERQLRPAAVAVTGRRE